MNGATMEKPLIGAHTNQTSGNTIISLSHLRSALNNSASHRNAIFLKSVIPTSNESPFFKGNAPQKCILREPSERQGVNHTEQFLEGASNKGESETQRQLEKTTFWGKLPMF